MELRHLRYFVATADAGSVSGAALDVHVTQPALSRQLRQLEQDLGVDLFERGAGRLLLSRSGRALLPAARQLLASATALEARARFHAHGGLERVTIAAPTVTLTDVVSPFVATMSAEDPVVDVRSSDGQSVARMLELGADLAIGTLRPGQPYAHLALAVLPVWAYVRADDPWAGRRRVTLTELLERTIVTVPATFTAREALDTAVAARGEAQSLLVEAANGTIAQALAATGRGVAVVSDDPRFDLVPIGVAIGHDELCIRLVAGWDSRSVAVTEVESIAARLGEWTREHYRRCAT